MPAKRALIEHRPWLLASIVAAVTYYFVSDNSYWEILLILLKGSCVGLLAVYAWRRTKGADGAILVLALALSAAGDMVLVLSFVGGGVLFLVSHVVALFLYARNIRANHSGSQRLLAVALVIMVPLLSWQLSGRLDIAAYGAVLGAMAAGAWLSRFPRYRVGIGAVLFVVSDLLIFSRLGPFTFTPIPDLLVWPTYYAAQLMIASGVVQTLRHERVTA